MFTHLFGRLIKILPINFTTCKAGIIASFLLLLCACATPPQTAHILANQPNIPVKHEITNVPFFPQQEFYCGPAALSEVFNYYGVKRSQNDLAADLFVPKLEGSFQLEMVATTRQNGFVAYAEQGNLEQLLSLVSQNIPVVVLQNVSIPWYPMWHYAVVIGYDLDKQQLILRSGEIARHIVELSVFERTWQRGKYWILAAVPPYSTSPYFHSFTYARAAQDLLDVGKTAQGRTALQSAIKQWPDYWLSYFLLANQFLEQDLMQANHWYQQGYPFAKSQPNYLNNYAYALHKMGCQSAAESMITAALKLTPNDANLIDTQQSISKPVTDQQCPAWIKTSPAPAEE